MSNMRDADFQEHADMWRRFTRLITGSVAAIAVVLIIMALTLT